MSITGLPDGETHGRAPEPAGSTRADALRRPELDRRWLDRLSRAWQHLRERLAERRASWPPGRGAPGDAGHLNPESAEFWGPSERHAPLLVPAILIAVGSAALTLGAIWAWQAWSQRSAPPVDDRLPFIAEAAPSGDEPAAAGDADAGAAADATAATADSAEATDGVAGAEGDATESAAESAVDVGTATRSGAEPSTSEEDISTPTAIVVHVSGSVARPGVVTVAIGARVYEAVEAAGGAVGSSDLDRLNLAATVVDGERIHVPAVGEGAPPELVPSQRPSPTGSPAEPASPDSPLVLDLNRASATELEELPGVGPATAAAIVRTRDERGPFRSVDELVEVPGIGDTRLEQLRPHVIVEPP